MSDQRVRSKREKSHLMVCLSWAAEQHARIILRVDSGGGGVKDVNLALDQGHQVRGKDYSGSRAEHLTESVTEWVTDPRDADRLIDWVAETTRLCTCPVKRIAVRCRESNGQWAIDVILSSLPARDVLQLTGQPQEKETDPYTVLLAYIRFFDQRGGGVDIEIKEDKQGFQISKRNKKRFAAQQMVCQLEVLAHNLLVRTRCWLEAVKELPRRFIF